MIDVTTMTITDNSEIPLTDEVAQPDVENIEVKPDIFAGLYCKECNTHLNGGTICSNCGAEK